MRKNCPSPGECLGLSGGLKRAAPAGGMISRGSDSGRARAMSGRGGEGGRGWPENRKDQGERVRDASYALQAEPTQEAH